MCIYLALKLKSQKNICSGNPEDWQASLALATQRATIKEYCTTKGYDYQAPTGCTDYGACVYTEKTCKNDSNPKWVVCVNGLDKNGKKCDPNQRPYLEWHDGKCTTSSFPPSFIQNVCDAKGLGGWYAGKLKCDSAGMCDLPTKSKDMPTCEITEKYCDKLDMDYTSKDHGGCKLGEIQNIAEKVVGKTVTRRFKRNTEAMIRECKRDPFSANCALAIGTDSTTLDQIGIAATEQEFQNYMTTLKQKCSGNVMASTASFAECAENMFPGYMLSKQGIAFADNMLNGTVGWIPGVPSNLIAKAVGYMDKYGKVAINAIFHAGEAAVQAFDIAQDGMANALNSIGLGAAGEIIQGACQNVIVYGKQMTQIITSVAQSSIGIFVKVIAPLAFHTFKAVCDAVLHPVEFFENIGSDISGFFSDPLTSIKNAFTSIKNLGGKILDAVKMVINALKNVAEQLGGDIANDLLDVADHIATTFKSLGNDIGDAAKAAGSFFHNLF